MRQTFVEDSLCVSHCARARTVPWAWSSDSYYTAVPIAWMRKLMHREVKCLSGGYTASNPLNPCPCPCCKDHLDVREAPRREEVGMQVGSTEGLPRGSPCLWAPHLSGNCCPCQPPRPPPVFPDEPAFRPAPSWITLGPATPQKGQ